MSSADECLLTTPPKRQLDLPQAFIKRFIAPQTTSSSQPDVQRPMTQLVLDGKPLGQPQRMPVSWSRNKVNENSGLSQKVHRDTSALRLPQRLAQHLLPPSNNRQRLPKPRQLLRHHPPMLPVNYVKRCFPALDSSEVNAVHPLTVEVLLLPAGRCAAPDVTAATPGVQLLHARLRSRVRKNVIRKVEHPAAAAGASSMEPYQAIEAGGEQGQRHCYSYSISSVGCGPSMASMATGGGGACWLAGISRLDEGHVRLMLSLEKPPQRGLLRTLSASGRQALAPQDADSAADDEGDAAGDMQLERQQAAADDYGAAAGEAAVPFTETRQCLVSPGTGRSLRCARIPMAFVAAHLPEVACMAHKDEQPLDVTLVLLGRGCSDVRAGQAHTQRRLRHTQTTLMHVMAQQQHLMGSLRDCATRMSRGLAMLQMAQQWLELAQCRPDSCTLCCCRRAAAEGLAMPEARVWTRWSENTRQQADGQQQQKRWRKFYLGGEPLKTALLAAAAEAVARLGKTAAAAAAAAFDFGGESNAAMCPLWLVALQRSGPAAVTLFVT
ncbi:hypothetical protein COO60DRAFT_1458489, partial [Scenedesmus sp. NREL 46B-D3]